MNVYSVLISTVRRVPAMLARNGRIHCRRGGNEAAHSKYRPALCNLTQIRHGKSQTNDEVTAPECWASRSAAPVLVLSNQGITAVYPSCIR